MNILLINPNWNLHNNVYTATITQPVYPLEFLYIATLLSDNHTVTIHDAHAENTTIGDLPGLLRATSPDIIILETAPTYLFWRCCPLDIELPQRYLAAARRYSRAGVVIIGPHASASPQWTLTKTGADYLVRGEPELSLAAFINSNLNDMTLPGVYSSKCNNGLATVKDLASLPVIDYGHIKQDRYPVYLYASENEHLVPVTQTPGLKGAVIESSRGCPYHCPYCFKQLFRDAFRHRPVTTIIQEMQQLQETGVTYFYFIDEIFNIPGSHTKELLAALQKQNITFGCQCRPDIMTNEFLDLMVGAGCIHIEYGLESLNQDDLDAIGKNTSLEQSLKIIEKTSMLVPYTALFMLTFDTMTLAHKKGPPKKFSFKKCELSPARPYPTTELFKNLQANLGITIPEELQWEFIQKYVWHLGRLYAWIPIRLFIYIPYCLLVFFTTVMRKLRATILRKEW